MSQPWTARIGLAGVVVGGLLTGGLSWLTSHFQQRRDDERDRKRIHREKLEDLYQVVLHFK